MKVCQDGGLMDGILKGSRTEGGAVVFLTIFKHHKGSCDTPEEKTKRQKDIKKSGEN